MADIENKEVINPYVKNEPCQSALDLQKYLKDIVRNVLKDVPEDKFVQIYKKCYHEFEKRDDVHKPGLAGSTLEAKKYQAQFDSMVLKSAFAAVDQTVANINSNLKELEELKKEQEHINVFWRPPGKPSEHMIPFECICEREIKTELQSKIKKEEESLALLKTRLAQKRKEAADCHIKLLSSLANIENENTAPITITQMKN